MRRNKRVLIVDDNDIVRNTLCEYMLRIGFEIGVAKNGVEALKIFTSKIFDLVITDFQMPKMDGHLLACKIKKKRPKTEIIMISGDEEISSQVENVCDYFLEKPFNLKEMAYLINCAFGLEDQKFKS